MTEQKRFWGYVRLSQTGRGTENIEEQKQKIREYVDNHPNAKLITTISDGRGSSGFKSDREGFQTLLQKIENQELDGIVTRDRKRWARDFDLRLESILKMRQNNVEWHTTEEGAIGLNDEMNSALDVIRAAVDYQSKKQEIELAQEVVQQRMDEGYYQGMAPYGLQYDDDKQYLVQNPDEFHIAIRTIELVDNGETYRQTRRQLIDEYTEDKVPSIGTIGSIVERREWYRAVQNGSVIGREGALSL